MKKVDIVNIDEFPFVEFGRNPARKVRILCSPYTSGERNISIVHVTIPPSGISEGHVHNECDEYIYFDHFGNAIIDDKFYEVRENSIVIAHRGSKHACLNTSETEYLNLLCIFVPPLEPYGEYLGLIDKTKEYLVTRKRQTASKGANAS